MTDLNTFLLDEDTGDLQLDGQNSIRMIEGADEKLQAVRLLLQTNAGEWFLNTLHGLEHYKLLGQKPAEARFRAAMMKALRQESRIDEVLGLEFDYDPSTRTLTITFALRMDGEIITGQEVL
ncbi:MAG: DUF2634 domain-containing protein [Kiritimatiellae bacterium]|nr:DUF2634 domain-containing protein [Kiritimatiellia bacterium]